MFSFKTIVLTAAAAFTLTACEPGGYSTANSSTPNAANATANANAAKPVAAAPTKEALFAIEKQGWDAWKNKTPATFDQTLSSRYVGFGATGRQDKEAAKKALADAKCDIKGYSYSDEQMHMLGSDVAVLTYKAAQDGTCDGKKIPAAVWSSSVYVREGDGWKNVHYSENPVVDPNAPPAKATAAAPSAKPAETSTADASKPDAMTTDLMAVENRAWGAWKNRDVRAVDAEMAKEFTYVSGTGRKDKAAAIKAWTEPKCEGLSYSFSDPKAVSLSKDVAVVTYKADVKGTCDGKPVDPTLWVASFDVKEGDAWKNAFYTDVKR